MDFVVTKEQVGPEAWVVQPRGEIDLYTSPTFRTELLSVIESGANSIVVDFSETTFIDSTGLGVLLGARKRLPSGVLLSIVSCDKAIVRMLEVTCLDRIFPIFTTAELARNAT
jgi:anti-sigma B factor antagonist